MSFKHSDLWFWDSWYAKEGDTYHGYFLQAPKSLVDPDARRARIVEELITYIKRHEGVNSRLGPKMN